MTLPPAPSGCHSHRASYRHLLCFLGPRAFQPPSRIHFLAYVCIFLISPTVTIRNMVQRASKTRDLVVYPIEHRVASRQKRQKIQDIVLTAVYSAAALGMILAAPNTVQLLRYVKKYTGEQEHVDRRMYQALLRLRSRGLLTKNNTLTKSGRARAAALCSIEDVAPKVPFRWDRKWRIVMFDIWETRRTERNRLRGFLQRIGFAKIQESVWVYPYPCEELFVYLRAQLRLGRGVRYMVVEEIDNDTALRQGFDLPKR